MRRYGILRHEERQRREKLTLFCPNLLTSDNALRHDSPSSFDQSKVVTQKEITSQTDKYLVILSSKTYVFESNLTKY